MVRLGRESRRVAAGRMSANARLLIALVGTNHCIPILVTPFYLGVALAKTEAHRA